MKKLKLNLQQFEGAEVLTRSQLKKVLGGGGGGGTGSGDGGQCYMVQGEEGKSSCWYATSGNADSLCSRVYPNDTCISSLNGGSGICSPDCHMN